MAQFKALDPSTWPHLDRHDLASKKAFLDCGKQGIAALHEHYIEIFRLDNILLECLFHEFVGYKIYALLRKKLWLSYDLFRYSEDNRDTC